MLEDNTFTTNNNPLEPLLKAEDVARILSIGLSTVYLLQQRGDIPSIHIGRSIRFRRSDIEDYIERNKSQ